MNEREIFVQALRIAEVREQDEFLDQACGVDSSRRKQVADLLAAYSRAHSFLEVPIEGVATLDQPITEKPGTQIGPYKLLQQVGEGGMGVVYMAEQKEPVKRRVALKIIKPGMDTRQVIARFEAERQALAMMDRPNIAKVLDAGRTDSGHPYFVMELVKGVSITQFCDEKHLTPRERLELFVPVCQAIQHAHQKGIIHRDIKPSNVLVGEYDDRPMPRIIDFGIAKATSQTLTEKTVFTQLGQVVGTLEYMSPEQAERNQLDIDTRSDIYSLGVVLYELLTGETPFDGERLRSAAFEEMLRIIRDEEPSKPSTKVSSSQSLPSIAANRRIEPGRLGRTIRGELDWIVMKALEKDRGRRYETASRFAEDVQHHLNDEPVAACPPSRAYRFRKFARRNKAAILTAAVVFLTLLIGGVGTTWQAVVAMNERDRAVKAETLARTRYEESEKQRKRADVEAEIARTEAATAEAVTEFINEDLFASINLSEERNPELKVREVLDRANEPIEQRFVDQPMAGAAVRETLGNRYNSLGEYETAYQHFSRALKIRERLQGDKSPETLKTRSRLAATMGSLGQRAEAEQVLKEVITAQTRILGPEHKDTLGSRASLAALLITSGSRSRAAQGEKILREVLEVVRRVEGDLAPKTLTYHATIAIAMGIQRRAGAHADLREVHGEMISELGAAHPRTIEVANNLALSLVYQGQVDEAEALIDETIEAAKTTLGDTHPDTLKCLSIFPNREELYRRKKLNIRQQRQQRS